MQVFVGGANAILLLLTVVFVGFLTMVGLIAWRRKNRTALRTATAVGVSVIGIYVALLLSAALVSKQRILAAGEIKWFCGFYLDCHLGVSVSKVESVKNLPGQTSPIVAKGVFKIVTVEFHNSARNQSLDMTLFHPVAEIVDEQGRRYQRSVQAEQAIAKISSLPEPVKEKVLISHAPSFGTMAFDISADAVNPKLSIEEGFIVDRVLELVLVNDDNSVLHQPTFLALAGNGNQQPTSYIRNKAGKVLRARLASR